MRERTRRLAGADEGTLLLGTVGHFGADKGVDLAIGAFQAFLRRNPGRDARLLVLGRGDPAQESEMRSLVVPVVAARNGFDGFQTDLGPAERGVGKEGVMYCRSRVWPEHYKQTINPYKT